MSGVAGVVAAEWTKLRTVRATLWTTVLTVGISAGLGYLVGLAGKNPVAHAPRDGHPFDPLFFTFDSLTFGQLALVVFGVVAVCGEYSTGTIRASLMAVPRRGLFYAGKVLAVGATALAVAVAAVFTTFAAAQVGLGPYRTSLAAPGVAQAVLGGCLYLTLICLFATGLAAVLRRAVPALGILLPLLFLGSQGLGNVPHLKTVLQYLPDEAGMVILHLALPGDPRFGRSYGPWAGLCILAAWTCAALLGGYLVLRRRDAR